MESNADTGMCKGDVINGTVQHDESCKFFVYTGLEYEGSPRETVTIEEQRKGHGSCDTLYMRFAVRRDCVAD